jgi:DNA-directed RNA polymerase subunit RPC12/RpoP
MGLFGKLFGGGSSGESVICSQCGSPMKESGEDRYECSNPNCYNVSFRENGEIVDAFSPRRRGSGDTCDSCGQSLSGGDLTLPWEDGDNAEAYVRCKYCGHKNIKYGYGEDD